MTEAIIFSAIAYAFVGGTIAALTFDSGLDLNERAAIGAFWPLVVIYLAITGLGKLSQRLGQEDD